LCEEIAATQAIKEYSGPLQWAKLAHKKIKNKKLDLKEAEHFPPHKNINI
jgi:hypothetical protein